MEIEELQSEVIEFRDARDWEQYHNANHLAISLSLGVRGRHFCLMAEESGYANNWRVSITL